MADHWMVLDLLTWVLLGAAPALLLASFLRQLLRSASVSTAQHRGQEEALLRQGMHTCGDCENLCRERGRTDLTCALIQLQATKGRESDAWPTCIRWVQP